MKRIILAVALALGFVSMPALAYATHAQTTQVVPVQDSTSTTNAAAKTTQVAPTVLDGDSSSTVSVSGTFAEASTGSISFNGTITPGATADNTTVTGSGWIYLNGRSASTSTTGVVATPTSTSTYSWPFYGAYSGTISIAASPTPVAAVSAYSSSFTVGAVTSVDSFTPYSGATMASLNMLSSGPELVIVVPSAGKVYHVAITMSNSMPADALALYTGASYAL
jgi:hypothetical protein